MISRTADECDVCSLCGRIVPSHLITLHHLLPKQKGGKADDRVPLCKPCHKQIHATFGNGELARMYTDLNSLRSAPQLARFLKWIRRQKSDRVFRTVTSNAHPKSKSRRLTERRRMRRSL
jgi:5-methylcytosine-specific restriction enzyme A